MIQNMRTRRRWGGLTGLAVFAAMVLLPCLCSTAWAMGTGEEDSDDCCPSTVVETDQETPETPTSDCCCEGGACSQSGVTEAGTAEFVASEATLKVSPSEDEMSDWLPTALAVIWLADRLQRADELESDEPSLDPSRSLENGRLTYLQTERLLI